MLNKSYIYLLKDCEKNHYKIGITKNNIQKRINQLQTGNSGQIILINNFQTFYPRRLENMLHTKFQHKKILNEWFELDEEDVTNFHNTCENLEEIIISLKDNPFFNKNLK
jgi:hypothetical protein